MYLKGAQPTMDGTEKEQQDSQRDMSGADNKPNKLRGLSPRANYTDRATAACRRSDCQLLRIEGATWSS
jgi:hypothetical protein